MKPRAILSQVTDPFANLALESVLFKSRASSYQKLLFIYFNEPCVVIGRNQNPWSECDLSSNLPFLRRRSGGGAVVHDTGNVNFCVQFAKEEFSRTKHLQMIVDAFPQSKLAINERNDLVQLGEHGNPFKVSGSSYKIEKLGAYHHATLLLNSNLGQLTRALKPGPRQGTVTNSGGTESVRSPVKNTMLSRKEFVDGCVEQFAKLYGSVDLELATPAWFQNNEVKAQEAELRSWDWRFGKTPKFTLITPCGSNLLVERGKVVEGLQHLVGKRTPLLF